MQRVAAGFARQFNFVSSGHTISTISVAVYDDTEALVSSAAATSSGNGHYFAVMPAPSSLGIYRVEWRATYGTDAYGDAAIWPEYDIIQVVKWGDD